MRLVLIGLTLLGTAWSQTITEAATAAAGSTVGSVAGKQVNKGVGTILGKGASVLDKAGGSRKASPAKPAAPILQVGAGTPRVQAGAKLTKVQASPAPAAREAPYNVPPPPPLTNSPAAASRPAAPPRPQPVYAPPPPPPPVATRDDLNTVTQGMARRDVLDLGTPSSRISMYQDGHLVEIYRYMDRTGTLGVVRLSDGAVSQVSLEP